jgi:hypothetical protein
MYMEPELSKHDNTIAIVVTSTDNIICVDGLLEVELEVELGFDPWTVKVNGSE